MAHAPGWIEVYGLLEEGRPVPDDLRREVLANTNGVGETMLHWYALEGAPRVVEKVIDLGFDVNATNKFRKTPLFECVMIGRWEIVEILLRRGASTTIKDHNDEDIFEYLELDGNQKRADRLRALLDQ